MDASTRVALAGVAVSLLIGLATWWLQRREASTARDLGLIDQIQEERTHFQLRARESDADLDSCRDRLNDAHAKLDFQLESLHAKDVIIRDRDEAIRLKDRKIAELQSQLDERDPPQ